MRGSSLLLGLSGVVLLAACGGNVVYVEDGDGSGGSGSGTSGPGTTGPSTGTGTTSTSVTTGGMTACQAVCSKLSQCFMGDCLTECGSFYVPGCEAEADALLYCAVEGVPPGQCELPPGVCELESNAFSDCANGNPPPDCSESACAFEVCTCSASCFGGTLVADCDAFGPSKCDCYFNDQYLGSCDGQTCEVQQSCCYDMLIGTPDGGAP